MASVFILGAGQTTLLISLPAIMEETGIGYGLLSGMVALGTGLFVLSAPIWGKVSDRYGRKPVVVVGALGVAFSFSLIALSVYALLLDLINRDQAIIGMFMGRALYGVLVSGLYPAVQAWAIEEFPENRSRNLSRITASVNGGRLIGPLLPALLISYGSIYPLLFIALSGMLLFLWIMLLPLGNTSEPIQPSHSQIPLRRFLLQVWPFLMLACSITTLFGFLQYLMGPKLLAVLHTGAETSRVLSWLMMLAAFSTIVAHVLFSRWVQKQLPLALKTGSSILLVGTHFMVCSDDLFLLVPGLILSAASVTLLTPAYTALAVNQAGQQLGVLTGSLSMIHTAGYTLGALLAGIAVGLESWQVVVTSVLVASAALVITFLCVDVNEKSLEKRYVCD